MGDCDQITGSENLSARLANWIVFYCQQAAQDDSNGTGTSTPGLPLSGDINFSLDANVPHNGTNRGPILTDRFDRSFGPFDIGGDFSLRGGHVHAESSLTVTDGSVGLDGEIVSLSGVRFFDTEGCPAGDLIHADGDLFVADSIRLTSDGAPEIVGRAPTPGFGHRTPFTDALRLVGDDNPYVFAYGLNADNQVVCNADERDTVTVPFPVSTQVRDQGIPHSLDLFLAARLADESNLATALGGCDNDTSTVNHDPNLDFSNFPEYMITDPLLILRQFGLEANLRATGRTLNIPPMQGMPAVQVELGEGTTDFSVNASFVNPEQQRMYDIAQQFYDGLSQSERESVVSRYTEDRLELFFVEAVRRMSQTERTALATELADLRLQRTARAQINTNFDLVSVNLGGRVVQLPVSGNLNIDAQLRGLFPTQDIGDLWAHVAVNGQIIVDGDIVVPAFPEYNLPEIRLSRGEGNGLTRLSANNFAVTMEDNTLNVSGSIDGEFNFSQIQVDDWAIAGPHNGNISVAANDQSIVLEMGGRLTLPRDGYPVPLSIALTNGYLEFENFRVAIDNNIPLGPDGTPQRIAGTIGGTININDVQGTIDDHSIEANASVVISDGSFRIEDNMLDLDMSFSATAEGNVDGNANSLAFSSDLSVHDIGMCTNDGDVTWRDISIENTTGAINGSYGDFGIQAPAGSFGDGPIAELDGQVLLPGIHITADTVGLLFGQYATAQINQHVSAVSITTPQGTFELTGQLVGTVQLVNVSEDPMVPDFKPLVGGLRFELRGGNVTAIVGGQRMRIIRRGTLEISDGLNDSGQAELRLSGRARTDLRSIIQDTGVTTLSPFWRDSLALFLNTDSATIQNTINSIVDEIPRQLRSSISTRIIPVNSEAVQTYSITHDLTADQCFLGDAVMYYSPTDIDDISIPSFVSRITAGSLTTITTRASFEINDLQTNPTYSGSLRTSISPITIGSGDDAVQGTISFDSSRTSISGDTAQASVSLRTGGFQIDITQRQSNGNRVRYQGSLDFENAISVRANLESGRIRIPRRSHPLTGVLTITETNAAGETVGNGRVRVETNVELSGRASSRRARFRIHTPETTISGTAIEEFTINGTTIPTGAGFSIPIRTADPLEIDVNIRNLMRGR